MAMYPPVFAVCAADATLTALVGAPGNMRLYPAGEAPRGSDGTVEKPYIVWQIIGDSPENYMGQAPDLDAFSVQFDVYAVTFDSAWAVAEALRNVVEQHAYVTRWNGDGLDEATNLRRYSFDTQWHTCRVVKTALVAALATAAALNEDDYTPDSWAVLAAAVTAGTAVNESQTVCQIDVDLATQAISVAINGLVETTPPTVVAAEVETDGTALTITFSEDVTALTPAAGWSVDADSAEVAVLSAAFNSAGQLELTTDTIYQDETVLLSYDAGAGDVEGVYKPLASFEGTAVVNNSTQTGIPLIVVQDTFTNDGASAVNLNAHTPDVDYVGGGWTVTDNDGTTFTGTQTVNVNDTLTFTEAGSSGGLALIDCGVTTGIAAKTVAVAGQYSRWVQFMPRFADKDNWFILAARVYDGTGNAEAIIFEKTAGVVTMRATNLTAASSPSPGDITSIWFQDNGSRLSIGFDGAAEALGYDSAAHFGGSNVGFNARAQLGTGGRTDIATFTVISQPDYTQLP